MADFRTRVVVEGDYTHLTRASKQHLDAVQNRLRELQARFAATAGAPGVTHKGRSKQLQEAQVGAEAGIHRQLAAGEISPREAAAVRGRVRQMFADIRRQVFTELRRPALAAPLARGEVRGLVAQRLGIPAGQSYREIAQGAVTRQGGLPASRGGDPGLFGVKVPEPAELRQMAGLLANAERMQSILDRTGRGTVLDRRFGLQVGRAVNQARLETQDDPFFDAQGRQTTIRDLVGERNVGRKQQQADEDLRTEELLTREQGLQEQRASVANLRKRRRTGEKILQDEGRTADDLAQEVDLRKRDIANRRKIQGATVRDRAAAAQEEKANQLAARDVVKDANIRNQQRIRQIEVNRLAREQYQRDPTLGGQYPQPPRATLTQRLQGQIAARQGGEFTPDHLRPRFGQVLGSRLLTTASFALSGAGIYGAVAAVRELITSMEELQRIFSVIEAQFEAVGDSSEFAGFRRDVLGIARDLGIAGDEAAFVAFQMKGAYEDTGRAVRETEDALKASVVTGLAQKELTDSLTAASISYGVSIEDVTDKAIGLEERFGVLARESLKVFGDIAPVAKEAGLQLEEVGAIIGVIQQSSGRGGAAIAEGLGRVLPAIQESAAGILRLYQGTPQLAGGIGEITEGLREGRTGDVLLKLVRDYEALDDVTKKYVVTLLGGRREAQILNPLFLNSSKIIRELERSQSDAGKTSERFERIQKTLQQTLKRLREEFRQLGDALGRAGLLDALGILAGTTELVVGGLGDLLRVFGDLNELGDGLPGRMLSIAAALKAIQLAVTGLAGTKVGAALALPAVASRFGRAGAVASGAAGGGLASSIKTGATGGIARLGLGVATGTGLAGSLVAGGIIAADIALIQQALNVRDQVRDEVEGLIAGIRTKLESKSDDEIQKIIDSGVFDLDLAESLGVLIAGEKRPKQVAEDILAERRRATFTKIAESDIDLDELIPAGPPATPEEERLRRAFNQVAVAGPNEGERVGVKQVARNIARYADEEAYADSAANFLELFPQVLEAVLAEGTETAQTLAASIQTIEEMEAAFQSGEATFDELIKVYRAELAAQVSLGQSNDEARKKAVELRRKINKALSDQVRSGIQFFSQLQEIAGEAATAIIPRLEDLLRRPPEVTTGQEFLPHYSRPLPESPEAQAVALDPELQREIALDILARQQQAFRDTIASAPDASTALRIAQEGQALSPETKAALEEYARNNGLDPEEVIDEIGATAEELRDLERAVIDEQILGIQAAIAGVRDPVAQAQVGIRVAQVEQAAATTKSEALSARIQMAEAQRAMQEAISDIFASQSDLAIAMAEVTGDTIRVARLRVDEAARRLNEGRAGGAGEAELNRLNADLVRSTTAARDAQFQKEVGDIDFFLQMEQITSGQAIRQLEGLLPIYADHEQKTRDLLLKIKSLRDSVNQEFIVGQGDLRLPTLYEVNRVAQTPGGAGAYQDNRRVNATFYINTGMDLEAAREFLADAVGTANIQYGTYQGAY